jgi:hypothetical protein
MSDTLVSWHPTTQPCYPTQPSLKIGKPPRTSLHSQPPTLAILPLQSQFLPPILVLGQAQLLHHPRRPIYCCWTCCYWEWCWWYVPFLTHSDAKLMIRSSWNFDWCGSIGWICWGYLRVVLNVGIGGSLYRHGR